jgi:hypothetical protein
LLPLVSYKPPAGFPRLAPERLAAWRKLERVHAPRAQLLSEAYMGHLANTAYIEMFLPAISTVITSARTNSAYTTDFSFRITISAITFFDRIITGFIAGFSSAIELSAASLPR